MFLKRVSRLYGTQPNGLHARPYPHEQTDSEFSSDCKLALHAEIFCGIADSAIDATATRKIYVLIAQFCTHDGVFTLFLSEGYHPKSAPKRRIWSEAVVMYATFSICVVLRRDCWTDSAMACTLGIRYI